MLPVPCQKCGRPLQYNKDECWWECSTPECPAINPIDYLELSQKLRREADQAAPQSVNDTLRQRGARYGTLASNAAISQAFKKEARLSPSWEKMSPSQRQAVDVIFDKLSRILAGDPHYDDNWRDIAGYATLVLNEITLKEPHND